MFITFEGIDCCGKSTQAKLLYQYLKSIGEKVLLTQEPGGTNISNQIRSIVLSPKDKNIEMCKEAEFLLYSAARAQHSHQIIKNNLKSIIISDRYYDSSTVYQGIGRGIPKRIIKLINDFATFKIVPDITFLIDIDVNKSLKRLDKKDMDRIENESMLFHQKIREGFLNLAKKEPHRIIVKDGNQKVKNIHQQIIKDVKKLI